MKFSYPFLNGKLNVFVSSEKLFIYHETLLFQIFIGEFNHNIETNVDKVELKKRVKTVTLLCMTEWVAKHSAGFGHDYASRH